MLELVNSAASIVDLTGPLLSRRLAGEFGSEIDEQLEHTLLGFPQPQIMWIIRELRVNRQSLWNGVLGTQYPVLYQRGWMAVKAETGEYWSTFHYAIVDLTSYLTSTPCWS